MEVFETLLEVSAGQEFKVPKNWSDKWSISTEDKAKNEEKRYTRNDYSDNVESDIFDKETLKKLFKSYHSIAMNILEELKFFSNLSLGLSYPVLLTLLNIL